MNALTTLCLAHDLKDKVPNGCDRSGSCQRHLAFRARAFPEAETIIGCACVKAGYPLYVPVDNETAA